MNVIDLGAAEIALPPAPGAQDAVAALARHPGGQAPPGGVAELRELLAVHLTRVGLAINRPPGPIQPTQVVVVAGASAAASALLVSQSRPGQAVLLPDPGFPAHRALAATLDRPPRFYPAPANPNDDRWVGEISRQARGAAAIVWNAPHNATGRVATAEECAQVAELARRHGLFLISDEVCSDLTWTAPHYSPLATTDPDRAAVVCSGSKSLRLAGYRVGWLAGTADVVAVAAEAAWSLTMSAPMPGQVACAASLREYPVVLAGSRAHLRRNLNAIVAALNTVASAPGPQGGPCAWFDVRWTGMSAPELTAELERECGVRVWPGDRFGPGGRGHVRINAGAAPDAVDTALARMTAFLRRLGTGTVQRAQA